MKILFELGEGFTVEVAEVTAVTPVTEKTRTLVKRKNKILQREPSVEVVEEVAASVPGSSEEVDHDRAK